MTPVNFKKTWTTAQEEMVLNSYGETTLKSLARKLGRSERAVSRKYGQLIGSTSYIAASGKLTTTMIAEAFGVHYSTVCKWTTKYGLECTKYTGGSAGHVLIDDKVLWKWLLNNKNRVDFVKCKTGILVPEPKWYIEEIESSKKIGRVKRKEWTMKEIQLGCELRAEGFTYKQIAEKLNRTKISVEGRLKKSVI